MKKALLTVISFLTFFYGYSQHPYKQKLSDFATMTFPHTPKIKTTEISKSFYCNYQGVLYLGQATSLESTQEEKQKGVVIDTLYRKFIDGLLQTAKGKSIYEKPFLFGDLKGVEFEVEGLLNNKLIYSFQRVLYFNDSIVSYSVWSNDRNKIGEIQRTPFFNSLFLISEKNN